MEVIPTAALERSNFSLELQGKDHGDPGASLILVDAAPGRGPSLHTHAYAEIMVILEGTATFTDGAASREVGAATWSSSPRASRTGSRTPATGRCARSTSTSRTRSPRSWL